MFEVGGEEEFRGGEGSGEGPSPLKEIRLSRSQLAALVDVLEIQYSRESSRVCRLQRLEIAGSCRTVGSRVGFVLSTVPAVLARLFTVRSCTSLDQSIGASRRAW